MDKKSLTEQDIHTKYVTPAIKNSGWDIAMQVREEVTFTAGRITVRGELGARQDTEIRKPSSLVNVRHRYYIGKEARGGRSHRNGGPP